MNNVKTEMMHQRVRSVPHIENLMHSTPTSIEKLYPERFLHATDRSLDVQEFEVTSVLLGSGKPSAGIPQSGEVNVVMSTSQHPLNATMPVMSTVINFDYYDEEGERHRKHFTVPKLPTSIEELSGWFDLLLSLEDYDDGTKDNVNFVGFTKDIHIDFMNRIKNANRNPKYAVRFKHAISMAQWGVL